MSAILVTGFVGLSKMTSARGLLLERPLDAGQIFDGQHGVGHGELGEQMLHDVARRPVGLDEQQHMIAGLAQRQQARGDRRDTRAGQQAIVPALQLAQQALQLQQGRIGVA